VSKIKVYLEDWNNVMTFVKQREELELVSDARDADCIILWQDVRNYLAELCVINEEYMHKPVVIVQHGRGAGNDYLPPNSFPMHADKFCCWGTKEYNRLLNAGFSKDRLVITGSPLVPFIKPKQEHDGKNIVFCPIITNHEEPDNINTYWHLKRIELKKAGERLMSAYGKLRHNWHAWEVEPTSPTDGVIPYHILNKNWRLIAKLTYIHDKKLYIGDVVQTAQQNRSHMEDVINLLSLVDCAVGIEEGTFQLLAMAMGIPVVMVEGFSYKDLGGIDYSNVDMIKTKAARRVKLPELEKVIDEELANPDALKEEREKVLKDEFWDGVSDPIQNIVDVIKGVVKNG